MAARISKEELQEILTRVFTKDDYDSMQTEIEKIAEEYDIDLTEIEEGEEEDYDPLVNQEEPFFDENDGFFDEDEDF